jgi:hypothetical protein
MKSWRILGCTCVLVAACAAPNTGGPTPSLPDAAEPTNHTPEETPPSIKPDTGAPEPQPTAPDADPGPTSPPPADAAPATATADAGSTTTPPAVQPDDGSYTCTLIIGINATQEWYSKGFESMVDNGKWELAKVHSGFVELWADPKNSIWNTTPSSACTQNANNPDRIIFIALNFDTTMLDQWVPPLTAVVKNLKAKYPGVKRIELGTFVRAPGNKPCPQAPAKRSTIAQAEDDAIAMVAAANPDLVRAHPKFEAKTCSEFSGNPPHPSAAGGAAWSKMYAEHYGMGK